MSRPQVIHKFRLLAGDTKVPAGRVLSVQTQDGHPTVWVQREIVSDRKPDDTPTQIISLAATGVPYEFEDGEEFIGTVQLTSDGLVFHVFRRPIA